MYLHWAWGEREVFLLMPFFFLGPNSGRPDVRDLTNPVPSSYRPEIDGLRALAVLSVVFYHAGLSCSGGFVGVDVFFVISGYLITALLLRDIRAGQFSLAGFWERRVRRIFPAAVAMILATLVVGAFLCLKGDYEKVGRSALAQSFMWANVFFKNEAGDYFSQVASHPLLHMWSLAVEEQFYVIFPLVLLLFSRSIVRRPAVLKWVILVFIGISLAVVVVMLMTPKNQRSLFYLMHPRAWELLCGALVAAFPPNWALRRAWAREWVTGLGVAGIVLPVWLYSKTTLFPGLAALPPCLGTAAIIWANQRAQADRAGGPPSWLGRILALRPLVWVGLISYSLYLWHWPVLVFAHHGWNDLSELSWATRFGPVVIAVGIAALSWRWVELPFRELRVASSRRAMFIWAALGTGLVCALGGVVVLSDGQPLPRSTVAQLNDTAMTDWPDRHYVSVAEIEAGRVPRFGSHLPNAPVRLLLWGDSHSWCAGTALAEWCRVRGCAGEIIAYGGTPPLIDAVFMTSGMDKKTPVWAEAVLKHVQHVGIKEVVLAGYWSRYEELDAALLEKALRATIARFTAVGCRVWVLLDVPTLDVNVPRALTRSPWPLAANSHGDWRQTVEQHHQKNKVLYRLADEGLSAGWIDPARFLLDPQTGRYRADVDGVSVYVDNNHLTKRGARLVLLPVFNAALPQLPD